MQSTKNLTIVEDSFSGRLLGKLKEKGVSQDGLRILLGSKSTGLVSNWIRRDRPPKAEMLLKVAKVLDTTPHWLLYGDIPAPERAPEDREVSQLKDRVRKLEGQLRVIQQMASTGAAELTDHAAKSYDKKKASSAKSASQDMASAFERAAEGDGSHAKTK